MKPFRWFPQASSPPPLHALKSFQATSFPLPHLRTMPADRPSHQLNPSFPFDQRRGSSLSASSSSSSPSQHPSSVPSPCSTLESDYPETPPSFPQRIPIHGFSNQQQQQQQHHFPRPLTTSSFFPGEAQGQQHQQHQQLGGSNRVGGDGFSRPRELSVGYDPGGGGGERKVFEGGGGGQGRYSASPGFSPQDLVIYVSYLLPFINTLSVF